MKVFLTSVTKRVQEWYRGRYVPPPPIDQSSPIVVISFGHYQQPFLAKVLGVLGSFWLAHWQWIIGTALAIVGLFVALRQAP